MSRADKTTCEAAIRRLLREKEETGQVSNASIARAAAFTGLSTRQLRRRVASNQTQTRAAFRLNDDDVVAFYAAGGNARAAYRLQKAKGGLTGVSERSFYRGIDRHDQQVIRGARGGKTAHDSCGPTLTRSATHRTQSYATDHQLAHVQVLWEGNPVRPWVTAIEDECTRMIVSFGVTPGVPTTADLADVLAYAVQGTTVQAADGSDVVVGGLPDQLHTDRGGDFVSYAATVGLIDEGIVRSLTQPYTPNHNGKIERFHGYLASSVYPTMQGHVHPRYSNKDPKAPKPSTDDNHLLTLEGFGLLLMQEIEEYNYERVHSTLGMTPFEAWCADPHPIRTASKEAIRAAMRPAETRTVNRGSITLFKRTYVAAELASVEGLQVKVRYLTTDPQSIDVEFPDGRYVRAYDRSVLPESVIHAILAQRRSAGSAFAARMAAADVVRVERSRSRLAEAGQRFAPDDLEAARRNEDATKPKRLPKPSLLREGQRRDTARQTDPALPEPTILRTGEEQADAS